mmetsp:Transcript_21768/g.32260  ORF Transcript_21768/g.32260 Transcript_21768/m.32260 type:complete len:405 (-) Transcript_21768:106-1320(-)
MDLQSSSFSQKLKKIDYHSTVSSEFKVKTANGAILSLVTLSLIAYLTFTEFTYNLTPTLRERAHVNATTPNGIEMEFDVTFPSVPCALLSIDSNDPMGQQQSMHIDQEHRVWKHRVDKDGKLIGKKSKFELGNTLQEEKHLEDFAKERQMEFKDDKEKEDDGYYPEESCGSCYGAGEDGECCNTCDDVKRAYQKKGWLFQTDMEVKQCTKDLGSKDMKGEGCNVHGKVALSSGGGNLHLAPGHAMEDFGKEQVFTNLADFIAQAFETFNVSHTVNKVRFGEEYPGDIHQLDGAEKMVEDAYGMYQYYVQIVPTEYRFLNGTKIQTNQYSVTEHMRHVSPGSNKGLPGVFFFYEVSPLHVEIQEYRHGWIRFFTSVAAVVGGVFSTMSIMDMYVFSRATGPELSR